MKVAVKVRLKKSILDPQGKAVQNALQHLGFDDIAGVRIGKLIELEVPDGTVIAIGVLGSASLAMIASEVMATANQSEALLSGKKISIGPTVGYYASRQGKYIPTIGVNIKFK